LLLITFAYEQQQIKAFQLQPRSTFGQPRSKAFDFGPTTHHYPSSANTYTYRLFGFLKIFAVSGASAISREGRLYEPISIV
jgi:hypothetical protein